MDLMDAMKNRYSCRKFTDELVDEADPSPMHETRHSLDEIMVRGGF